MALPSLVIKCKIHDKLTVIMERLGAHHSSHVCAVQTYVFQPFGVHGIYKINL